MAESASPDSGDVAVRNFIETVALGFVLESIAALFRGENLTRVIGGLIAGAFVSSAGFKWPSIKRKMGERFARTATNVATDFRWWLAIALIVFVYLGMPTSDRFQRTYYRWPVLWAQHSSIGFSVDQIQQLRSDFLRLPRPCTIKITAPVENIHLRDLLDNIVRTQVVSLNGQEAIIPACEVMLDERDAHPEIYVEELHYPSSGMVIASGNTKTSEFVVGIFRSVGLDAKQSATRLPHAPIGLVWIQIGKGAPWLPERRIPR